MMGTYLVGHCDHNSDTAGNTIKPHRRLHDARLLGATPALCRPVSRRMRSPDSTGVLVVVFVVVVVVVCAYVRAAIRIKHYYSSCCAYVPTAASLL